MMKYILTLFLFNILLFSNEYYYEQDSKLTISDEKDAPKLSWREGVAYCQNLRLGGYDDWYLPSMAEMVSFEDRNNTKSFLIKALQHTHRYDYWSGTTDAMSDEYAWSQGLMYKAYDHIHNKDEKKYIRCVRCDEKAQKPYYVKYKDVVVEKSTNIMWQDNSDAASFVADYKGAQAYCQNLTLDGYDDWKLPDIKTLRSLVDYEKYAPALDGAFKHHAIEGGYYSKSRYRDDYVDVIGFAHGIDGHVNTNDKQHVRCYRKLQTPEQNTTIRVFFTYDNGWLFIDGVKTAQLHSFMDDFQATKSMTLPFGIYHLEVKRQSRDGTYEISGTKVIKLQSTKEKYIKIEATQKEKR